MRTKAPTLAQGERLCVCGAEAHDTARRPEWERGCVGLSVRDGVLREATKSSVPRLNLSGSWQQGHSAAYNTPYLIQVVCK